MESEIKYTRELKFTDVCDLCEKISSAPRKRKTGILQNFIMNYLRDNETSFYRMMRLLLPQLDRERGAYGIKETVLARIYIRILCLNPKSQDALKLKNYRAPKNAGSSAGDFGEVAFWVLKSRCDKGGELSIDQVHQRLDNIALRHAEKQPREVDKELESMLHKMSAVEQKWLIRVLLKDMHLGLGHNGILQAYHPDARELFDFTNSLQQVCDKLRSRTRRLHEIEVTLFTPCRPMLAERCDVQEIGRHWAKGPTTRYVETKLDGERSQVHYRNGVFKFFSRRAFDFTDAFGSSSIAGSLTPYLAKQLKPNVKNLIFDGEMMPWNTKYKYFGTKGQNLDVKTLRVGHVHQPCLCVFDLLLLNDEVLTNQPLSRRLAMIEDVFTPVEGIIMQVPRSVVHSEQEVLDALNKAIDNLEEGIVVKEPDSIYKPNSRKGGWIKIKPEYTAGAMTELDLLIIGGYHGEGKHRSIVSHFLLGVKEGEGEEAVYNSVARVGSGCSMDELAELGQRLAPHWHNLRPNRPPSAPLRWTREKPEMWIEPRNSVILQIKASEVVRSDFYHTGYTLRFPRIEKVRYDKPWNDCLTAEEFTKLRQSGGGSLVSSHITQQSPRAKKRRAARPEPSVGSQFRNADLDSVQATSRILEGKEVCVLTGQAEFTKKQLECKVVENGGTIVLNPGKTTFCVVVGTERNVRVTNVCKAGSYDVVRADWLLHSLEAGRLLPWSPADFVSASAETTARMADLFDRYGDSFTDPATKYSLKDALQKVDKCAISLRKWITLDKLLFNGFSPFSVFRGCTAYFDLYKKLEDESSKTETPLNSFTYDFKFHNGSLSSSITKETTHIVLYSSDLDRLEELIYRAEELQIQPYVVQHYWLSHSVNGRKRLSEDKFTLHKWTD